MSQSIQVDPILLDAGVRECSDALISVRELIRPTATNLRGDRGADVALERLSRLGRAVGAFPLRRLNPDPFAQDEPVKLKLMGIREMPGSSLHDALVRLTGRIYDRLRVIVRGSGVDPATGLPLEGLVFYDDGYEIEEIEVIDGVPHKVTKMIMGLPRKRHFTELTWTPQLWEELFEVVMKETLRWLGMDASFDEFDAQLAVELARAQRATIPKKSRGNTDPKKPSRGKAQKEQEGRLKIIAGLTKHHKYADGSCLNAEPIGNNNLARTVDVSISTASDFFKEEFGSHANYKVMCRDIRALVGSLKLLNAEFAPRLLLDGRNLSAAETDGDA